MGAEEQDTAHVEFRKAYCALSGLLLKTFLPTGQEFVARAQAYHEKGVKVAAVSRHHHKSDYEKLTMF